jgi:flagellar hook-associated protein 2
LATTTSLGIGSNLPLATLLENLTTSEQQSLTPLTNKQTEYNAKLSAFGTLKSSLAAFQTAAAKLTTSTAFTGLKSSLGTSGILSATAGSTASAGSYVVKVSSLAQSQSLVSAGQAATNTAIGTGTLTFDFGTVTGYDSTSGTYVNPTYTATSGSTKTVTIDSTNNTLTGIRDAINKAGVGVTASIVNDGGSTPYHIQLTSTATGEKMTMKVSGSSTELQNLVGYDPASTTQANGVTETMRASNANITVNGFAVTSDTNTIKEGVQGITFGLVSVGTTTVTMKQDTDTQTSNINDFVDAYNNLQSTVNTLTAFDSTAKTSSALTGDGTLRNIQVQLRNALNVGGSAALKTLDAAGISFQLDGTLKVDDTKLADAVTNNSTALAALFQGDGTTGGVARAVSTAITAMTGTSGLLTSATTGLTSSLSDIADQITAQQTRIDDTIARYKTQFTNLDTLVSSLNNTSTYLTQQFDAMNNSNN